MRVGAYVDGFNFYKGTSHAVASLEAQSNTRFTWKWLDIRAWVESVCREHWADATVEHAAYFTAPVSQRDTDPGAHDRQHHYLRALEAVGHTVVRGTFRTDPDYRPLVLDPEDPRNARPLRERSIKVWLTQEKGSDVNLATAALVDYFTRGDSFDASVVVSNDSDLKAPLEKLRERNWPTGILVPESRTYAKDLWPDDLAEPHWGARIEVAGMSEHQLPDPVMSPRGRPIRNPWRTPDKETPGR